MNDEDQPDPGRDDDAPAPPIGPSFLPPELIAPGGPGDPTAVTASLADPTTRRAPAHPSGGPRLPASLTSLIAVGGGLLVAGGLFTALGELDSYDQRWIGLLISVLFMTLGVVLSVINRSARSAAAGVAVSVIAVLPLTAFLFVNSDVFGRFAGSSTSDEVTNPFRGLAAVITLMLLMAATLWLAGYLLGPGRRYGIYLGAALLALWLIPMSNIGIRSVKSTVGSFQTTFDSSSSGSGSFDPSTGSSSDPDFNPNGSTFDSGIVGDGAEDPFPEPDIDDPSLALGVVSMLFGSVYLFMARRRDRHGDARMATAILVPALIILTSAYDFLAPHLAIVPEGILLFLLGASAIWVGVRGGRRFSAWYGLAAATLAVFLVVADLLESHPTLAAAALTILGVTIAIGAGIREGHAAPPDDAPTPLDPLEPHDPWGLPTEPAVAAAPAGGAEPPTAPLGWSGTPKPF